jgi:flagellar basal-body rod modification protein FlgD
MFAAGMGASPTFANSPNSRIVPNPDPANPVVTSPDANNDSQNFMRLMIEQLKSQDPMNPMDSSQFTQQLSSINSLQQLISMNQLLQESLGGSQISQATNLIGSYVTGFDANGTQVNGQVDHVEMISGAPALAIGGKLLLMNQVVAIGVAPFPDLNSGTTG